MRTNVRWPLAAAGILLVWAAAARASDVGALAAGAWKFAVDGGNSRPLPATAVAR